MKYKTTLKGLEFFAYHGLYQEEKVLGAIFIVDVSVVCELKQAITKIDDAVNYELIYHTAKSIMLRPQDLIETVAQEMIMALKELFPKAENIEVTIGKPNPGGMFKSGEASVTLSL